VWSRWTKPGEKDLLSFAIITDDPPPEIAAAGHDRCPVAIKAEHIDAWLNPDPRNLEAVDVILDARPSVYFVNRPAN
jgi:putative SOS response-associated peptidase YedK